MRRSYRLFEEVTDYLMKDIYGYQSAIGKTSGNQGIDGIYYKVDKEGHITDVRFTETKYNTAQLGKVKSGAKQTSTEWYKEKRDQIQSIAENLRRDAEMVKNQSKTRRNDL